MSYTGSFALPTYTKVHHYNSLVQKEIYCVTKNIKTLVDLLDLRYIYFYMDCTYQYIPSLINTA